MENAVRRRRPATIADRRGLLLLALAGGLVLWAGLAAGCAEGSYAPDNRHPVMKHGDFRDPRGGDNHHGNQ